MRSGRITSNVIGKRKTSVCACRSAYAGYRLRDTLTMERLNNAKANHPLGRARIAHALHGQFGRPAMPAFAKRYGASSSRSRRSPKGEKRRRQGKCRFLRHLERLAARHCVRGERKAAMRKSAMEGRFLRCCPCRLRYSFGGPSLQPRRSPKGGGGDAQRSHGQCRLGVPQRVENCSMVAIGWSYRPPSFSCTFRRAMLETTCGTFFDFESFFRSTMLRKRIHFSARSPGVLGLLTRLSFTA